MEASIPKDFESNADLLSKLTNWEREYEVFIPTDNLMLQRLDIAKKDGLADGLSPIDGGVAVHFACHARAQKISAFGSQ